MENGPHKRSVEVKLKEQWFEVRWIPARDSFLFRINSLVKEFRKLNFHKFITAYFKQKLIFFGNTAEFGKKQSLKRLMNSVEYMCAYWFNRSLWHGRP
jgi:hypothetical protein